MAVTGFPNRHLWRAGDNIRTPLVVYSYFNPGDGIMKNWLVITYPEAEDYEHERERIQKSIDLLH